MTRNLDPETVRGFGDEWTRFDQTRLSDREQREQFEKYFAVFPWDSLPQDSVGMDLGCGSGRWARLVAPRVGHLHCVDASDAALHVARRNLSDLQNCEFHLASVDEIPLADDSLDFAYSLGVLHHIPDTEAGLAACVRKLKAGAPLLVYLYYAFDNRPRWFRALWHLSEFARRFISRSPLSAKYWITTFIALTIYWPLARTAKLLEKFGVDVDSFPLSIYRSRSFYSMRTDAFDRFGTRLEKRFTAVELRAAMTRAGLEGIVISNDPPHWCAVGLRSRIRRVSEPGSGDLGAR